METKKRLHAAVLDLRPFKMFKTSIAKVQKLTRKCVSKELRVTYLQQYKSHNITPPGLKLQKTAKIKFLKHKQTWQQSLNKSSENLIDLLISQHESDLKTIKEQLETLKTQLNTRSDISNEHKKAFFNFLNKM